MKFPVFTLREPMEDLEDDRDFVIQRRYIDCIYSIANALICTLRGYTSEDTKLRGIIIYDYHNECSDFYSVSVGISRNGYATEYTVFCVPSDILEMKEVFRELFQHSSLEIVETKSSDTGADGVGLIFQGNGRMFLREFDEYIKILCERMDEESVVNRYGYINRYGIPAIAFQKMVEEFEKISNSFFW